MVFIPELNIDPEKLGLEPTDTLAVLADKLSKAKANSTEGNENNRELFGELNAVIKAVRWIAAEHRDLTLGELRAILADPGQLHKIEISARVRTYRTRQLQMLLGVNPEVTRAEVVDIQSMLRHLATVIRNKRNITLGELLAHYNKTAWYIPKGDDQSEDKKRVTAMMTGLARNFGRESAFLEILTMYQDNSPEFQEKFPRSVSKAVFRQFVEAVEAELYKSTDQNIV